MKSSFAAHMFAGASLLALAACGDRAKQDVLAGTGPNPVLLAEQHDTIPTLNIAPARGWAPGETPVAAPGLVVSALARGLDHPRNLYVLPNGDILVAETNAPANRPKDSPGIKGFIGRMVQKRAGAGVPSPDRIVLLREAPDGTATQSVFLTGLHSPYGMALVGGDLYVADTDALLKFPYHDGDTHIDAAATPVTELPAGPIDHHWTKNAVASVDGAKLYVSVGSNSNVAENGIAAEEGRAAIWEVDLKSGTHRIYAGGLRNPNGLALEPKTGALWTAVNERDELGSDLVPDYMTSVKDGGFYGWPYSYYGQHVDARAQPPRPDLVASAIVPDYALGPHTASLGLCFSHDAVLLPGAFRDGTFVGQHGSWNRKPLSGYKVIFVPFHDGKPAGMPVDVLTGFVDASGNARGRPVGVAIDKAGALVVADDVGNAVWRVTAGR